ncbi:endonuclease III [Myxococcota bacterium]
MSHADSVDQPARAGATQARRAGRPGSAAALTVLQELRRAHPDARCALRYRSPYELLVAVVLSAQTTDEAVNLVAPALLRRYPDPSALAGAQIPQLESRLSSIGMYRQKARYLVELARRLVEKHGGHVPATLAELVDLPGVGRKTANVVLAEAFGRAEGVVVDTHVLRLSQRLGLSRHSSPGLVERDLMKLFSPRDWAQLSHLLIFHGRRICSARRPSCAACSVSQVCPSAFRAERIGRKARPRQALGRA